MAGLAGKRMLSAGVAVLALGLAGCGSKSATNAGAAATTVAPSTTSTTEAQSRTTRRSRSTSAATPGVTPAEQHRAEKLLRDDDRRPREVRRHRPTAIAAGYRSIGDALTGDEHYVKWSYVERRSHPRPDAARVARLRDTATASSRSRPRCTCCRSAAASPTCPTSAARSRSGTCTSDLCLTDDPTQKMLAGLRRGRRQVPGRARRRPATRRCCTCGSCRTRADRSPRSKASAPARCRPARPRLCDTAHGEASADARWVELRWRPYFAAGGRSTPSTT